MFPRQNNFSHFSLNSGYLGAYMLEMSYKYVQNQKDESHHNEINDLEMDIQISNNLSNASSSASYLLLLVVA